METKHFKTKLESELKKLESELKTIGRINPSNPQDWEAIPADIDTMKSDSMEVAEGIDEYEDNSAILKQLEIRLNEVKSALKKIKDGTYGICEIGGEKIEEARLEANPAARTCQKHMK